MCIKNIINEEIDKFISEEYPQSFDMEYFKTLNSFRSRVQYCQQHLTRISSGSARIVYKIDDDKVLKLAKNTKGIAQNEVEIANGDDSYIDNIIPNVYDSHPDSLWLEAEYCKKISPKRFHELTEISFNDFSNIMQYEYNKRRLSSKPKNYDDLIENEFLMNMIDFMLNYSAGVGDLIRISSYGENSSNEVLLVDSGLNENVYKKYYSRSRFNENYLINNREQKIIDDILNDINENVDINNIYNKLKLYGKKGLLTIGILLAVANGIDAKGGNDIDIIRNGIEYVNHTEVQKFHALNIYIVSDLISKAIKFKDIDNAKELVMLRNALFNKIDNENFNIPSELNNKYLKILEISSDLFKKYSNNQINDAITVGFNYYKQYKQKAR